MAKQKLEISKLAFNEALHKSGLTKNELKNRGISRHSIQLAEVGGSLTLSNLGLLSNQLKVDPWQLLDETQQEDIKETAKTFVSPVTNQDSSRSIKLKRFWSPTELAEHLPTMNARRHNLAYSSTDIDDDLRKDEWAFIQRHSHIFDELFKPRTIWRRSVEVEKAVLFKNKERLEELETNINSLTNRIDLSGSSSLSDLISDAEESVSHIEALEAVDHSTFRLFVTDECTPTEVSRGVAEMVQVREDEYEEEFEEVYSLRMRPAIHTRYFLMVPPEDEFALLEVEDQPRLSSFVDGFDFFFAKQSEEVDSEAGKSFSDLLEKWPDRGK